MVKKFRNNGARSVVQSSLSDTSNRGSRATASPQQGFTIIEVMIVLAIAALILLIVLLAVPALQRNSRNTTIKNNASTVAGAVNTFESDNNGAPPTNITQASDNTVSFIGGGAAPCKDSGAPIEKQTISSAVSCVTSKPASTAPDPGTIQVLPGQTCAGDTSTRAFAVYYSTETSGGHSQQCLDT